MILDRGQTNILSYNSVDYPNKNNKTPCAGIWCVELSQL